jgi:hypothetical protein
MSFELDALQRMLVWRLAVTEEGEFLKDIKTSLTAGKRKALVREGFIAEEKRKRDPKSRAAAFLTLEEKGWNWCQEHLADDLNTRSTQAIPILERLLKLLADYFAAQDHTTSFGQFVLQSRRRKPETITEAATAPEPPIAAQQPADLAERIRSACLQLGHGQRNVRIRLADLRRSLGAERSVLDAKLLELESGGELSIYPLDDPQEIGPDDREAVLTTATGSERHVIYYQGK